MKKYSLLFVCLLCVFYSIALQAKNDSKSSRFKIDTLKHFTVKMGMKYWKYAGVRKPSPCFFDKEQLNIPYLTRAMDSLYVLQISRSNVGLKGIKIKGDLFDTPFYDQVIYLLPNEKFVVLGMEEKYLFGYFNNQGEQLNKRSASVYRDDVEMRPFPLMSIPNIIDNKLYFNTYNVKGESSYFDVPTGVQIDLDGFKVQKSSNIYYPDNYKHHYYYDDQLYSFSSDYNGNPICSFAFNDSIFVFPKNGDPKRSIYAGSSIEHEFIDDDKSKLQDRFYIMSLKYKPKYNSIVYDPVSKYYIRDFEHHMEFSGRSMKKPDVKKRKRSWIILDKDLNIVEEITTDQYNLPYLGNTYPTKDGLWSVYRYIDRNEIVYEFTLLQLKEVKKGGIKSFWNNLF
ncbi:MAG: hypothetical protein ACEPOW_09850 [Bacteroidales bacterium]